MHFQSLIVEDFLDTCLILKLKKCHTVLNGSHIQRPVLHFLIEQCKFALAGREVHYRLYKFCIGHKKPNICGWGYKLRASTEVTNIATPGKIKLLWNFHARANGWHHGNLGVKSFSQLRDEYKKGSSWGCSFKKVNKFSLQRWPSNHLESLILSYITDEQSLELFSKTFLYLSTH